MEELGKNEQINKQNTKTHKSVFWIALDIEDGGSFHHPFPVILSEAGQLPSKE